LGRYIQAEERNKQYLHEVQRRRVSDNATTIAIT